MEEQKVVAEDLGMSRTEVKLEEDGEDFKSCIEDEDELREREEFTTVLDSLGCHDEHTVTMHFKGVSIAGPGDSAISGIGVVMERPGNASPLQVQKKLEFFVEEAVAEYLALLDGLSLAIQNNIKRIFAYTDSVVLYDQIIHDEVLESPLLVALRQRILEQANNVKTFVLKLAHAIDLKKALHLAQVAVGIVSFPAEGEEVTEGCPICCEEKLSSMMLTFKCSHKFCSHCMKTYVEGKLQSSQVPIRCPQLGCKYCISTSLCWSFLPVASYESLERAAAEANILNSDKIYCPYPSCSVLLDPHECLSTRVSSSSETKNICVECPFCLRIIYCGVPWHSSMTCEEYQDLPLEERDASDLMLHILAQSKRWRRCQRCRRMIELAHGCYHMTCWCGHEFCYSCGAYYRDGQQTCQCAFWDEEYSGELMDYPDQQCEQWAWDSFESFPLMVDAYSEQERTQLALIQRFLAGGFSLTDPDQSPHHHCTDSYADAMKDLHQLPWLERFASVITNDYHEDYIQ